MAFGSVAGQQRTPGGKLLLTILLGLLLAIPLFTVYLLVYDRQSQSEVARGSIVEGWGGPQVLAGPFLVIPFTRIVETETTENGKVIKQATRQEQQLFIAPRRLELTSGLDTERRSRSIYEAVVYEAHIRAIGRFDLPDFAALNLPADSLRLDEAELRVGVSNAKGLGGTQPIVSIEGQRIPLIPGSGLTATESSGFTGRLPVSLTGRPSIAFDVAFDLRGSDSLSLLPSAQDSVWRVRSKWEHPSFTGAFLPARRTVSASGFAADWRIGNLALNRPVVSMGEQPVQPSDQVTVALIDPVNLYSEVNRATKYGFMFIGFTFLALLMFDIIGGVKVPGVAYLLIGAALVLFFVMLLALAEILGFTAAYCLAGIVIIALIASYAAAILHSWRRAGAVAGLLTGLYGVLYVLLSLEAYSLLIGSLMLLVALAGVMYFTRRIDWNSAVARGEGDDRAA